MKTQKSKFYLNSELGQTPVEYMLVLAVLAIGVVAAFMAPEFRNSISQLYNNAGNVIIKPGK